MSAAVLGAVLERAYWIYIPVVRIYELTEAMADRVVDLWHDAELVRPWNDPVSDLRRALDGPASSVLGAFIDAELVGTAMVGHDGHRGWVYYVAVSPDRQRQGIGTALMGAAERWLADRGIPKLNLMVRTDNDRVSHFYRQLGYGRDDVLVLSRRLGEP